MTSEHHETHGGRAPDHAGRPRSRERCDEHGRAYAGSQQHIQTWVNERPDELAAAILSVLCLRHSPADVDWRSPLAGDRYREYRDGAFLRAVGLERHRTALADFWPSRGPVWDGLAVLPASGGDRTAVLLVEAKSYPDEVRGSGCQAGNEDGQLTKIEDALDATARWLGVERTPAWTGELYQLANRIAHVYFLREIAGVDAYLANVCFTGDPPSKPTSVDEWARAHAAFREELGLAGARLPWLADVVLPAVPHTEPKLPVR